MATLLLSLGEREIQRLEVTKVRTWIGRDATCDMVIDNEAISRRHARVEYRERGWVAVDNESDNGLWVKGARQARIELVDGASFALGKFTLTFLHEGGVEPKALKPIPMVEEPTEIDAAPTTMLEPEYLKKTRRALAERDRQRAAGIDPRPVTDKTPSRREDRGVPGGVLLGLGVLIGALVAVILLLLTGE